MSSDYKSFDISSILTEDEQNELRSGTYTRTPEPMNEKMIHDSMAETVKQNTPSETGEVCPYPDFTVDKNGKPHLQATYSNFEALCRDAGHPCTTRYWSGVYICSRRTFKNGSAWMARRMHSVWNCKTAALVRASRPTTNRFKNG